jgi:hypothetical protein
MSKDVIESTQNEQAPQTPEEAILNLLGGEEEKPEEKEENPEEEGVEEEEKQEEPVYRVKVDGEEIEVPFSELLKGYQRQADYTRKTQRIAEERRKLQEMLQEAAAEREAYRNTLKSLEAQLAGPEPNWEELQSRLSPQELAQEMAAYQRRQKALQSLRLEQQRIAEIEKLRAQEMLAQHLEQERELLTSAIPEWVDAETARREKREIWEYARSIGFTDEELSQIYDHRAVAVLRKAWLYDRGLQKAREAKSGVQKPQTPPPGARSKAAVTRVKQARERLRQSGSIEDAAVIFESLL